MKDKILALLGNGIPASVVATSCGVSPSYVSQLQDDPHFAEQVATLRITHLTDNTARDTRMDKLEDALITKLEELIPYTTKAMEVTRIFQTLNAAKRRGAANAGQEMPATQQIITLNMPTQTINNFKLTERREVIEVDGRTLVSMQGSALLKVISARAGTKQLEVINEPANLNTKDSRETDDGAANNSVASALA